MTSSPVMGSQISNLVNLVSGQSNTSKPDLADFKSFMAQSTNQNIKSVEKTSSADNDKPAEAVKTEAKAVESSGDKSEVKSETGNKTDNVRTEAIESDQPVIDSVPEEKVDEVTEVIFEVIDVIKDELEVSDEDIVNAMANLGLPMISLLDAAKLPEIIASISGSEDALSIAMDENLYASLTNINEAVETAVENLSDNLLVPVDEFKEIITNIPEVIKEEAINEEIPVNVSDYEIENVNTFEASEIITNDSFKMTETFERVDHEEVNETGIQVKTFEEKISVNVTRKTEVQDTDYVKTEGETKTVNESKLNFVDSKEASKFESRKESDNSVVNSFVQNILLRVEERLNEVSNNETVYTSVDVEDVMNQITEFIKVDISEQTKEVNLRLHPESLGTVNVKVSANNEGVLTAQFTAQNESVKAIIESQALVLREALEQKGVNIEAVEVLVQSHEFERNFNNQSQNGSNPKGSQRRTLRKIDLTEDISADMSDDDRIVKEMMEQNGNTIDYSA